MKKAQKLLALLAVFALVVTALAACDLTGGKDNKDTTDPVVTAVLSPDDFYGRKIAVQKSTTSDEIITDLNKPENRGDKPEIIVSRFDHVTDALRELELSRVDGVYLDSVVAAYYTSGEQAEKFVQVYSSPEDEPIVIAFNKASTTLHAAIETVLDNFAVDGTLKQIALNTIGKDITEGLRTPAAKVDVPAIDAKELRTAGKFTIGYEPAYPPMEYTEADGVTVKGFDVDLAKALAAALGLEPVFVPTQWNGIQEGLLKKSYDAIISSFSYNPERANAFLLTKPYVNNEQSIVILKKNVPTTSDVSATVDPSLTTDPSAPTSVVDPSAPTVDSSVTTPVSGTVDPSATVPANAGVSESSAPTVADSTPVSSAATTPVSAQ
jgi:ABC-type amino acid transport substrate-binding protein